jgi:hypothetical protein
MYEFDIKMPGTYKQMLLQMVNLSKRMNCLTLSSVDSYKTIHDNFLISIYDDNFVIEAKGDPIITFQCLDFIHIIDDKFWANTGIRSFVLLPKAYQWAEYQNKKPIFKLIEKAPSVLLNIGVIVSFIFSIASLYLSILQILGK